MTFATGVAAGHPADMWLSLEGTVVHAIVKGAPIPPVGASQLTGVELGTCVSHVRTPGPTPRPPPLTWGLSYERPQKATSRLAWHECPPGTAEQLVTRQPPEALPALISLQFLDGEVATLAGGGAQGGAGSAWWAGVCPGDAGWCS